MLPATTDERAVLASRNFHSQDDALAQFLDGLLELGLELVDELGFAPNANLVASLTGTRATRVISKAKRDAARCTYKRIKPAWSFGSVGPPARATRSRKP